MITRYGNADAPFLSETLKACDFGKVNPQDIATLFHKGVCTFYVSETEDAKMGVVVFWRKSEAQFIAFHRTGGVHGLKQDAIVLFDVIKQDARKLGCNRFIAQVERSNPRAKALLKFYDEVVGLKPTATIVEADIS